MISYRTTQHFVIVRLFVRYLPFQLPVLHHHSQIPMQLVYLEIELYVQLAYDGNDRKLMAKLQRKKREEKKEVQWKDRQGKTMQGLGEARQSNI